MKIRVNTKLPIPRSGSANPQERTGSGAITLNLNSLNASGNVFAISNCSQFADITIKTDDSSTAIIGNTDSSRDSDITNRSVIRSVKLGNDLSAIGLYAFNRCYNLSSIEFPNNIKKIEAKAFSYSGLKNINIPKTVTSIGDNAFNHCSSLSEVSAMNDCSFGESIFGMYVNSSAASTTDELKNVYFYKQSILGDIFRCRKYRHTLQEGEDPSLSAMQIYYYANLSGQALSAQEDSPNAIDEDGTYLSGHNIPSLARSTYFTTNLENYDIHVPTSMYKRWIAAPEWNAISSHIYPYGPVEYVAPTMELDMDDGKTYIVTSKVGSIAMNVVPSDGENPVELSALNIAEEE